MYRRRRETINVEGGGTEECTLCSRRREMINVANVPVALGILFVFFPNNNIKSDFCCISYLKIKNN